MGKTNKLHPVEVFDTLGIRSAVEHLQNCRDFGKEKLLLAVFAVNKIKHLLVDKRSIDALDMAERSITHKVDIDDIFRVYNDAWRAFGDWDAYMRTLNYATDNFYTRRGSYLAAAHLLPTNDTIECNIQWVIDHVIDAIHHHALTEHNKEWGQYIAEQAVEQLWADVETKFIEIFKGETK